MGWTRWTIAIAASAVSLTSFTFGLRSPSYYTVVFMGLLVVVVGMCRAFRGRSVVRSDTRGHRLVTSVRGKPTSAAALAILVLAALAASQALSIRLVLTGLARPRSSSPWCLSS